MYDGEFFFLLKCDFSEQVVQFYRAAGPTVYKGTGGHERGDIAIECSARRPVQLKFVESF